MNKFDYYYNNTNYVYIDAVYYGFYIKKEELNKYNLKKSVIKELLEYKKDLKSTNILNKSVSVLVNIDDYDNNNDDSKTNYFGNFSNIFNYEKLLEKFIITKNVTIKMLQYYF